MRFSVESAKQTKFVVFEAKKESTCSSALWREAHNPPIAGKKELHSLLLRAFATLSVRERFEDSPKTPEIQDMGSDRDSEKA